MTSSQVRYQADIPVFDFAGAPCIDSPNKWFSHGLVTQEAAKRVCISQCPHLADCLVYALAIKPSHGVWAGRTPDELQILAGTRRRHYSKRKTNLSLPCNHDGPGCTHFEVKS
jgi:hypothetical protein